MNNIIITESSKNIRMLARKALKGMWKPAVLVTFIFLVCLLAPTMLLECLFGSLSPESIEMMVYGDAADASTSVASSLYAILVTGAFTFGITLFFLEMFRKKRSDIGEIFSGFGYYGKTLGLYMFMSLFIALWTLLLIVPGIIASFRYSQAFYILADDPSKGIRQCMNESKALMKGNKSKFFWLQMSFIGWYALEYLLIYVMSFAGGVIAALFFENVAAMIALIVILIIAVIVISFSFILPYIQMANTVFFEMVTGRLRPANSIPPTDRESFDPLQQ